MHRSAKSASRHLMGSALLRNNPWLIPTAAIYAGPWLAEQSKRGRDTPALACPDTKLRFGENIFLGFIILHYDFLFVIMILILL